MMHHFVTHNWKLFFHAFTVTHFFVLFASMQMQFVCVRTFCINSLSHFEWLDLHFWCILNWLHICRFVLFPFYLVFIWFADGRFDCQIKISFIWMEYSQCDKWFSMQIFLLFFFLIFFHHRHGNVQGVLIGVRVKTLTYFCIWNFSCLFCHLGE